MLYVRMLLIMAVTLYSSRIVLRILGVEDYGIYNVVGGVITMLSFLTNSLGNAGSRFITYALGEGDPIKLKEVLYQSCFEQVFTVSVMCPSHFGLFVINWLFLRNGCLQLYGFTIVL